MNGSEMSFMPLFLTLAAGGAALPAYAQDTELQAVPYAPQDNQTTRSFAQAIAPETKKSDKKPILTLGTVDFEYGEGFEVYSLTKNAQGEWELSVEVLPFGAESFDEVEKYDMVSGTKLQDISSADNIDAILTEYGITGACHAGVKELLESEGQGAQIFIGDASSFIPSAMLLMQRDRREDWAIFDLAQGSFNEFVPDRDCINLVQGVEPPEFIPGTDIEIDFENMVPVQFKPDQPMGRSHSRKPKVF